MSPPENGKAGDGPTRSGLSEKHFSNSAVKVAVSTREGKLWPANVELLRSRGVAFTWQKRGDDIRMSCPHCAGVLVMHEEKPWHHCHGIACGAYLFTFSEIVAALPVDQSEVSK